MTENCLQIEDVSSGKSNVHLFGDMTKTSVPSDKNVPLTHTWKNFSHGKSRQL